MYGGGYILNVESELIYIVGEKNINKVLYNLVIVFVFIKIIDFVWKL